MVRGAENAEFSRVATQQRFSMTEKQTNPNNVEAPDECHVGCNDLLPGIQKSLFDARGWNETDLVMTPSWCAQDMVAHFQPSGRVLDPCRGDGAFSSLLTDCEWCEIRDGRDFYEWTKRVDWIIGNPPYSGIPDWCRHSFKLADDIAYLIPCRSVFLGPQFIESIYRWGGIVAMRHYGGGQRLGFPFGNAIAAFHFRKQYDGPIKVTFAR